MNPPCFICEDITETKHLPLYVAGSEGVVLCLHCRMALTEMVRSMATAARKAKKQGYLAAKEVAEAKRGGQ